jgi:hypothetical protein
MTLDKDKAVCDDIYKFSREFDYTTFDFAIDHLVGRFQKGQFLINLDGKRNQVWDGVWQSRFVESILIGYPIVPMFFLELDDGRMDIVDGARRILTLEKFLNNDLELSGLRKLEKINQMTFDKLPPGVGRQFVWAILRVIALRQKTGLEVRRDLYHRINGLDLTPSEPGSKDCQGKFINFLEKCSENDFFKHLCPISPGLKSRDEHIELPTRFFAYVSAQEETIQDLGAYLAAFANSCENGFDELAFENEFQATLIFVEKFFPNGFKPYPGSRFVPRVRFEAMAVGVALALREKKDLTPAFTPIGPT